MFLEEMTFLEAGKMTMLIDNAEGKRHAGAPAPWVSWTRGVVLHRGGDHTASKYLIKELGGKRYLFFEWKSAETIYFRLPPEYYVLQKED